MAYLHWGPRSFLQIHSRDNYLASRVPGPERCERLLCVPGQFHFFTLYVRLTLLCNWV